MNTIGHFFRFTAFGESHGPAIGGVVDGMPAGLTLDLTAIQEALDRRRPGTDPRTSTRREPDRIKINSGIFEGKTTGTPIAFTIDNSDARSTDYDNMRDKIRPGHADATYTLKYGLRDHRGGGRASARTTAATVAAGAIAAQFIAVYGIKVKAVASQIGRATTPEGMLRELEAARAAGDTVGGAVTCIATGCPAGLGEPIFGKLQARLAAAMMSINAAKSFEYGDGTDAARLHGSESLDTPTGLDSALHTSENRCGGILGGISTGEDITMRVCFKPIATMMRPVETIDLKGSPCILDAKGRHDVCAVPRAVPVVEAMACLTLADALLAARCSRI
jgi:chorismate synthase